MPPYSGEMPAWERELLAGTSKPTVDDLMRKYAGEIDKMYEYRTRGDFSSLGIMASFMLEMKENGYA